MSKRQARTDKLLLALTLFAPWASTTAFLVLNTFVVQYLILRDMYISWLDYLTNSSYDYDAALSYLRTGFCGGTVTLTINVRRAI